MDLNGYWRQALSADGRRDEAACVADLLGELAAHGLDWDAIAASARPLVEAVRRKRRGARGVDQLMHEFSLSSQEGVALMCLAEALLRIPDAATADRLIGEQVAAGNWQAHVGRDHSLFVNAAAWGLMLTGKVLAAHEHGELGGVLSQLLRKGGEPLVRKGMDLAMGLLGQQFVSGTTIADALARGTAREARGYRHSFDMLGEAALTAADAERYYGAYADAIAAIGAASGGRGPVAGPGISVKLSALHPRYGPGQRQRVLAELGPRLKALMLLARSAEIGLNIDAEEAERLELSLDLFVSLAADPDLAGWTGMGFVVQAYQKRAPRVIDLLVALGRRQGRRLMVRLVKGAYWDSEIKRAQVDGQSDYPVFTRKAHTDLSYLVCAGRLLAAADAIFPQFATHNAHTLAAVVQMARAQGRSDFEFQCLHGMGESLYDAVVGDGELSCRIYAPVGPHATLLPYLVRRLLENGANTSFVHRIVDPAVPVAELLEPPPMAIARQGGGRHPAIPLPRDLYGPGRVNSAGFDLADHQTATALADELARLAAGQWRAQPLVAGDAGRSSATEPLVRAVCNPARSDDRVGSVVGTTAQQVEQALAAAAEQAPAWRRTPPAERAAALLRAADLLEAQRLPLLSLLIREGGKTWANAVAEVREAVDFCRYYAGQVADGDFQGSDAALGPVLCISPWNFPLAIFLGQISAALAAGNTVIAKPAEQTPLVAFLAVQLLHRAGIPLPALQFLPGPGATIGAALAADFRVRGVLFTGSTTVARSINQALARRGEVRLVAETGGQNAMIVDSSALPEQVVQDVMVSAFDSAGQRCSALRVLCLQEEIADRVLTLLRAALLELALGDPAAQCTDIGPVIDVTARARLLAHVAAMGGRGRKIFQAPLPAACGAGSFVPPTVIEIAAFDELEGEVFGPILHVLRFRRDALAALVATINGTGYGLTLGVHSRLEETVGRVGALARVGNLYVNRSMVGAVVGVQPFGGEGLSGTGPKAGGPLYLHWLAGHASVTPARLGCRPPAAMAADSPLLLLRAWAEATGRPGLARRCDEYRDLSLAGCALDLPGPTGERNRLYFVPRGPMLCLAGNGTELLEQLAAVWASGNRAVVGDDVRWESLFDVLPRSLAQCIDRRGAGDFAGLAAILWQGDEAEARGLRQRLAAVSGPLIPWFTAAKPPGYYPLYRLVTERAISTNTTAAGGNTALLTLAAPPRSTP